MSASSSLRKWLIQSPPAEWALVNIKELLLAAVRQGAVPQHVAFVMDGNRRYARSRQIETIEGHNLGFEALARILEVCYKIGVKVVTIYAFSIENFKRTKYEVDALMDMAKVKLSQLAQHGELLARYGARMEFLGQRDMVRPDVLEAIDKAIKLTSSNGKAVLNICAPYTSRDEITTAIRNTVMDFSQPMRPTLKRPFSESHIARNIRAQQLSTVSEGEEPTSKHASGNGNGNGLDTDDSMDSETMGIYNRVDDIVERYLTDLSVNEAPSVAPTDMIIDCLRDQSLSEEAKRVKVDEVLDGNVEPSDFAELQSLADQMNSHLDRAASSTASTTLNLSTSDPLSTSSQPTNYRDPESITANTLTAHTFTGLRTPPLDLLIRTSGVERLSDFMLWQCHQETEIVFLKCMWPEFDLWGFLPVLLEWQWRRRKEGQVDSRRGRVKAE